MAGVFAGPTSIQGNQPASFTDRWRTPGDMATMEKLSTTARYNRNAVASSLAYTNGEFLRLKNVAISYQIPEQWQKALEMKNARLFVNGQNLYTFTGYKGLDPETGSAGLPPLRVITIGVQASF